VITTRFFINLVIGSSGHLVIDWLIDLCSLN
jgi:hypothetical protein